jgi:hypothetical protein
MADREPHRLDYADARRRWNFAWPPLWCVLVASLLFLLLCFVLLWGVLDRG